MTEPRQITKQEWERAKRHGYASIRAGQRYILARDKATGGTTLEPVDLRLFVKTASGETVEHE